ncbi:MAG: LamG-like jellyroll fold domain-containing protein [Candidatus Micrarchaeia archaeon]
MNNLKGFIFTLDALFALIIAAAGISILLYIHPLTNGGYSIPVSEASSMLNGLLNTNLQSVSLPGLSNNITSNNASLFGWPQFGNYENETASTAYGPETTSTLFSFNTGRYPISDVLADKGLVIVTYGDSIVALNATDGRKIYSINTGSNITGMPATYMNEIIYANSTGFLCGANIKNGTIVWTSKISVPVDTPILVENGYATFGSSYLFYLVNPLNGSVVSTNTVNQKLTAMPPVYDNGEYIVSASGPLPTTNFVYGFALEGTTLVKLWSTELSTPHTTIPIIANGRIILGSGSNLYDITTSGIKNSSASLDLQVSGIAYSNGFIYAETKDEIYSVPLNASGELGMPLPIRNTPIQSINETPTFADGNIYVLINGSIFQSYNISNRNLIFSVKLPSEYGLNSQIYNMGDIVIAYGNAYVSSGDMLYAFGGYITDRTAPILYAIAEMYLNKQGAEADIILNSTAISQDSAMFINGTYAPSISMAYFDGNSAIYELGIPIIAYNYTISAWFKLNNSTSSSGPNGGEYPILTLYNATNNGGIGGGQTISLGNVWAGGKYGELSFNETNSKFCSTGSGTVIPNKWYNAILSVYGYKNYINVIIYLNGKEAVSCHLTLSPASIEYPALAIGSNPIGRETFGQGFISNIQLYNSTLQPNQASALYALGIFSIPPGTNKLVGWWPLLGTPNDYSHHGIVAIQDNVSYEEGNVTPETLLNAYEVSKESVPLSIEVNGTYHIYNVSVVIWH